jgi:RNA polymerase sigma-70 factor (ECF subfamily)
LEAFKELEFTKEELERAIGQLPPGYGMVFKLYVIDGFKHKEIAEQLGIDLNTSKSQLSRARRFLQEVLAGMSKRAKEIES